MRPGLCCRLFLNFSLITVPGGLSSLGKDTVDIRQEAAHGGYVRRRRASNRGPLARRRHQKRPISGDNAEGRRYQVSGLPSALLHTPLTHAPGARPPQHTCMKSKTAQPHGPASKFTLHLEPRPTQKALLSQGPGLCQRTGQADGNAGKEV